MNKIYMMLLTSVVMLIAGCSKEDPFVKPDGNGEGKLLKSALAVDVKDDEIVHQTRAEASLDNFQITITKVGDTKPALDCLYKDMPEIVVLPEGDYVAKASLGSDLLAAWENPYFTGASETFTVKANEITSYLEPIVCTLQNIKVSITIDPALRKVMSADSKVTVKVGDNEGLEYEFADDALEAKQVGYFKHSEETTLVATFNGHIEGSEVSENKSYQNPQKGHHYKLTFKLHTPTSNEQGEIKSDIRVDASLTVINVTRNIKVGDDILLEDNERPKEGGDNPGGDDKKEAPVISGVAPIDLNKVNTVDGTVPVGLRIVSFAQGGFQEFQVQIVSPDLTPDALEEVGLAADLNLTETPEQFVTPLTNFGFPVNVKGQKEANIEISTMLLGMLAGVGAGHEHQFILTVTDANGTTTKTLKLFIPE